MGYRSEIGVVIATPKNKKAEDLLKDIESQLGGKTTLGRKSKDDYDYLFETIQVSKDGKHIALHADWIKWYDSYDCVRGFMNYIHNWEDKYKTGGIHFVRIGEQCDDTEEIIKGNPDIFVDIYRGLGFETYEEMTA